MKQPAVLVLAFSTSVACGQMVIGTKPGLVTYVEDSVYLNDQKLAPAQATFPTMANTAILRSENGRAEVLLNPCTVLHLGENSSLRMVDNDRTNARLALLTGSAIVHVDGRIKDSAICARPSPARGSAVPKRGLPIRHG